MKKEQLQKRVITRRPNGTKRIVFNTLSPSKTDQSFKEECDVNVILDKFMKTGSLTHLNRAQASYSDVSEIPDLLTAHTQLAEATHAFKMLPAEIRKKLNNNPLELEAYLADPKNKSEAIKYGLLSDASEETISPPAKTNDQTNETAKDQSSSPATEKQSE